VPVAALTTGAALDTVLATVPVTVLVAAAYTIQYTLGCYPG